MRVRNRTVLQLGVVLLLYTRPQPARAQPEAPYPDGGGWLPLVYEHTADGYDNHDEKYLNKGECLPGSTVQLRGHIQCVSGNQEWYVSVHRLAAFHCVTRVRTSLPIRSSARC